ncbi:MAG TPA: hypothetical protein ENK18_26750 [Deltaproteobacteria bacterium]|nr:hypothetical protein [Deltaproteobacteria bacterium]
MLLYLCVLPAAWAGPSSLLGVGEFVSPGPLAEPHAHLSGITQCTKCHAPGQGVIPERCMACHEEVETEVRTGNGFHRGRGQECVSCHPDHQGASFPLTRIDEGNFAHGLETGFSLKGEHSELQCTDCHSRGSWANIEPECASCHEEPHLKADRARPLATCDSCHTTYDWGVESVRSSVLDHTDLSQVDFVLEGAHLDVECIDCHEEALFVPTLFGGCDSCHENPHRAEFDVECTDCHGEVGWRPVPDFDHELTGYTLQGVHAQVECEQCHGDHATARLPHETCTDCHEDIHRGQFGTRSCDTCHSVRLADFALDGFDHDESEFPLRGNHAQVECEQCHGEGRSATYTPVAHADCDDCHEDIHEGQFEPTACRVCHVEEGWDVEDFDHDRTNFPLVGKHQDVECEQCHPDEQWSGIHHDFCEDCHTDHPHDTIFDPPSCEGCHTPNDWLEVYFEHLTETGFDLAPQHSEAPCMDCHVAADQFAGLETACEACHLKTQPFGHYEGGCDECHQGSHWLPADLGDVDHAMTGFALRGAHTMVDCVGCHGPEGTPYGTADASCVSCHAEDDIHRSLLGQTCDSCHNEIGWFRTRFRHQQTGWPLRGSHRLAACVDCHAVAYAGTPEDCRSCHEIQAPLDVLAHQSAFFPQCDRCHRPYTWGVALRGVQ